MTRDAHILRKRIKIAPSGAGRQNNNNLLCVYLASEEGGEEGGGREKGVCIKIRTLQSVTCLKFEI